MNTEEEEKLRWRIQLLMYFILEHRSAEPLSTEIAHSKEILESILPQLKVMSEKLSSK